MNLEFNAAIKSQELSNVVDFYNPYTKPTLLCPWGCSEFLHMSFEIDLDLTMQRFIESSYFHTPEMDKFNKIKSDRDDYIRNEIEYYRMWSCNSAWCVLPTIVFKDGTPLILTYKYHDKVTNHFQVHCCRFNPTLSSPISDQLFHDVVKPRTVNSTKLDLIQLDVR